MYLGEHENIHAIKAFNFVQRIESNVGHNKKFMGM